MLTRFTYAVSKRFLSQECGQSTVEFAAMLTVVLLLVLGLGATGDELKELYHEVAHFMALL